MRLEAMSLLRRKADRLLYKAHVALFGTCKPSLACYKSGHGMSRSIYRIHVPVQAARYHNDWKVLCEGARDRIDGGETADRECNKDNGHTLAKH
jgi:hypothetical protein